MDWDTLRTLTCEDLWKMKLRHVYDAQGKKSPQYFPRPIGCRCPL